MPVSVVKFTKTSEQVATLKDLREQILSIAEEASADNIIDVVAELENRRYTVTEPLVFSVDENPGLAHIRLSIKAKRSMRPTISNLTFLSGADFTPVEGTPYYKYQFEKDENGEYPKFYDFFHNDTRLKMVSTPSWRNPFDLLPEQRRGEVPTDGLYAPLEIVKRIAKAGVCATQLRMRVQWQQYILRVKDVDLDTTVDVKGEPYALVKFHEEFDKQFVPGVHSQLNIKNCITYFGNTPAYLTEPDTFAYDWNTGTVYVVPQNPATMARERYGYATLSNCFVFKGMKDLTLEGLLFTGFTSPFVCEAGYFGTLSNRELRVGKLRQAPVVTSNIRNFTVKDCAFRNLGTNGLMLCDRTVRAEITGCQFVNIAMCGISIGNYRVGNGWADYENQTYNIKVVNNYLERIAYEYPSAAAIFVGFCDGAELTHNTVDRCGYSAFAVGDGYNHEVVTYELGEAVNLRNVEIAYNRVLNFMDVCRDGGAIYVTGANCTKDYAPRFNSIHHNFAALDSNDHPEQIGYYLDGAASNWDVYDNVVDNCQIPLFIQHNPNLTLQHTHHNRVQNFYSTTPVSDGNHTPWRDVILGDHFVVTEGLDALYEKHPHAKEIADGTGYREPGIINE